jgi:hypothetical protein
VFYSAFIWKFTDVCKHRFGVQLLQNPPLCSNTIFTQKRIKKGQSFVTALEKGMFLGFKNRE